MNHKLYVVFD